MPTMDRAFVLRELAVCSVKQAVLLDYYGRADFDSIGAASAAAAYRLRGIAGNAPPDLLPELDALTSSLETLAIRCEWAALARVTHAANWPHSHPNWIRN